MPRKAKQIDSKGAGSKKPIEAPKDEAPAAEAAPAEDRIIERPDGFYWESKQGKSRGPFPTLGEAEADILSSGAEEELEDAAGLQEAESELGINDWIDPDTGGPAEDNVPRIEDH